jgi:hypothetical protein
MSGNITSITDSTRCINKTIVCSDSNGVHHINEDIPKGLDKKRKDTAIPVRGREGP